MSIISLLDSNSPHLYISENHFFDKEGYSVASGIETYNYNNNISYYPCAPVINAGKPYNPSR